MTPQGKQEFERRRAEYHNPLAFVPDDVCVIAYLGPGFSEDLSRWRLTLSSSGLLTQDVILCRAPGYKRQKQQLVLDVGGEFVQQVLTRVDELDFWNLEVHSDDVVTDTPYLRILIRHNGRLRDYFPEAVSYHAYTGNEEAERFIELWNLLHSRAPFPES